jgi:CO/xanthine dehydrogenase Mo-binding subunit
LAATLDQDPLAFRLRNILKGGDLLAEGATMHATGLAPCLQAVTRALPWRKEGSSSRHEHKKRGQGLALFWNPATQMANHVAEALLHLGNDGLCCIAIDTIDGGQGVNTFVAQLAASELGIPLEWIYIEPADTCTGLYQAEDKPGCDTACIGSAVLAGARQLKQQIVSYITPIWEEEPRHIDIIDGVIVSHATERSLPLDEFMIEGIDTPTGRKKPPAFAARGRYSPHSLFPTHKENMFAVIQHFSVGAVASEIEVDTRTGTIQVLKLAAALDVGHAINPALALSQIKGGTMQGLSAALLESLLYGEGVPENANLQDYLIASFGDLPAQLEAAVIQVPQDDCPYGARSIGADVPLIVAPALANALAQAVGVRLTTQPLTPERVWRVLAPTTQKEEA